MRKPVEGFRGNRFAELVKYVPARGTTLTDILSENRIRRLALLRHGVEISCRHAEMPRSFDALGLSLEHGWLDITMWLWHRHPADKEAKDAEQLHGRGGCGVFGLGAAGIEPVFPRAIIASAAFSLLWIFVFYVVILLLNLKVGPFASIGSAGENDSRRFLVSAI